MSIANLTRYDQDRDCDCGQTCMLGMCEYLDGEYVKFEEAVEVSSNSLQQLKSEIAAIADLIDHANLGIEFMSYKDIAVKLRQLSAV